MRIAGEDLYRPDPSMPLAGHQSARSPISVVVGVTSLVASSVWIAALTPPVQPTLTVEPTSGWLLFYGAFIVGTLLGVRILWGITWSTSAIGWAFLLSIAIQDPRAHTIGGFLLLTVALVCLVLPSAKQFEQRRIRLD